LEGGARQIRGEIEFCAGDQIERAVIDDDLGSVAEEGAVGRPPLGFQGEAVLKPAQPPPEIATRRKVPAGSSAVTLAIRSAALLLI
jgi:hypothetical protein